MYTSARREARAAQQVALIWQVALDEAPQQPPSLGEVCALHKRCGKPG